MNRRTLLKHGVFVAGAALTSQWIPSVKAQPIGANNRIRIGIIGLGMKGSQHLKTLQNLPDVQVTALCDVDPGRLAEAKSILTQNGSSLFESTDLRRLIERDDVDAVIIATSTHWHALATVWACEAGKDVYVEKPVGRTIAEGRTVIKAARRYNRIVQTGTQLRSDSDLDEITDYIHSGKIGKIQWIQGVSYKLRSPLEPRPLWYPDWMDYDLYCGPSPMTPLERDNLHYDWHWRWRTGNGDLVNMGVHSIDLIRRFLGNDARPSRVMSLGGRYVVDDVADPPNTQLTVMDFDGVPLFYENRNLPVKTGATYSDRFRSQRIGIIVQCEHGHFAGYDGGAIFDHDGNRILRKATSVDSVPAHLQNFFDCVRSRNAADLNAPPEIGHYSAQFGHFGNLSYRVGHPASAENVDQALESLPEAINAVERTREHLRQNDVDLMANPMVLGPWLKLDSPHDAITGIEGGSEADLGRARGFIAEADRPGYVTPALS
jgi:predicted dehydrogenase